MAEGVPVTQIASMCGLHAAFVREILGGFRVGRQDVAEFWIEMHGRFVHIRYFTLRDGKGEYLCCLEVAQDLTHERALTGERRLMQCEKA